MGKHFCHEFIFQLVFAVYYCLKIKILIEKWLTKYIKAIDIIYL